MKQIILFITLILAACIGSFAQRGKFSLNHFLNIKPDEFVMFDTYGDLSIKDEKARLDNLFITIQKDKNLKSLVVFRFNRKELRKKKIKRLKDIAKFFDYRKVDKTKFTLAILDDEKERTEIWAEPQDVNLEDLLSCKTTNCKIIKAEELKQKIDGLFRKNKTVTVPKTK